MIIIYILANFSYDVNRYTNKLLGAIDFSFLSIYQIFKNHGFLLVEAIEHRQGVYK